MRWKYCSGPKYSFYYKNSDNAQNYCTLEPLFPVKWPKRALKTLFHKKSGKAQNKLKIALFMLNQLKRALNTKLMEPVHVAKCAHAR